ncbi:MAG: hypothetical protein AAFX94_07935 [Myxococcota bacterium]
MKKALILVSTACALAACTAVRTYRLLQDYTITLANSEQEDSTETEVTSAEDANGRAARILSAFFGLDDALPKTTSNLAICEGADGKDGMPVIFSHELDFSTLQAGDFQVTTAAGKAGYVHCVTLAPADDTGELRTALLVGHYGSIDDPPVKVEIVGNLLSMDRTVNFKGASAVPIELEKGPTLILAEALGTESLQLGGAGTALPFGGGTGCPDGTLQAVRAVWVGGVTKPGGDDADDNERQQYRVTVQQPDGRETEVVPFALADLNDGDNNHMLCLDVAGTPKSVFLPAGLLTDPRDDLNPDTRTTVSTFGK